MTEDGICVCAGGGKMGKKSKRMALCGMMAALAVTVMLLGGVIPLATFCCPMFASLALLPILVEAGRKWTLMTYVAVAALGLMMCPDKEAALLFAFMGYYPALKPVLDRIAKKPLRVAAKLGVFNIAAGAMLLVIAFVLNMQAIMAEYAAMGVVGGIVFAALANITMLMYDRMLLIMVVIYLRKLRPTLMGGR